MTIGEDLSAEFYALGRDDIDPFGQKVAICEHRRCGLDCVTAVILDERGEIASREIRVLVRCMDCGTPCAVDIDRVRRPRGGERHGIVLVVEPEEA